MNILIDITHPAHVHFFKHAYEIWLKKGHQVLITAREKDVTLKLLQDYGYSHRMISEMGKGFLGLGLELVQHEAKLARIAKKFRADVMLEIGGTFIVHAGKLLGITTCVFTDTEHAKVSNAITFPFASYIITPECYKDELGEKQVRYKGYQELAYMHPKYFRPAPHVLEEFNLQEGQPFFVVRFVSWGASHDVGQKGLTLEDKVQVVKRLSEFGRVIITSEGQLPEIFMPYQMQASPTKIHDLLYYAGLYIGEGATMASEAAILGTPSIYTSTLTLGYLEELAEKYQLIHNYIDGQAALEKAIEIVSNPSIKKAYKTRAAQMIEEKTDVTQWMVDFVESL
jgi:uncharacterized protein